ncbi:putative bifunctional diguanylate cyclase/phosphodiesterase [Magnetospirillum gryphiswaldense]|uniref:GGDEF: diguanylate cyclase (GGDEF) domain n=2 Tax=Magnetospirillum gryphiswaldense TaxID=55518 RepID=V6EVZ1_MAGGM|nr:EAL domain-containing protein [Magnetospirillum gryphiswaldense]AVM74458.1 Cyclic di-GMP phosphodiesterase Gmr [Magnetospirillum gryphiswaldense MSR-1]AVM78361.1 Cyclic di-GMP phosphodiesterase Gmr [Magnetospirillum gryphiswaldense]CAM75243.1 PAS:GGDEF [Magnetospirillum gryphiswaldense MSR-1]CDK97445.1 putative GGDEF: diguanylate cyclase (GGDEF) domain [Magnetospirillum gryphiswaldense MSR-1 v2]
MQQRLAELERENAELRLFRAAFDMAAEAVAVCGPDWRLLVVNPAFTAITGFLPEEVCGRHAEMLYASLGDGTFLVEVDEHLRRGSSWEGEVWSRRKTGEPYRQSLSVACEHDMRGGPSRHVLMFRDVSEARDNAEKLWRHSNYDTLTELPNRGLLLDRLLQALVLAGRENCRAALLFIGLDGFKTINDTLGMTVGDMVLRESALRFGRCLRKGDTLGRFGGDEFIAVLPHIDTIDEVEAVVRTILESLQEPLLIEANQILLSCSIGISLWPGDGEDVETLMRNSSSALEHAKAAGRGTFRFFTPTMDARAQARSRLAGELSEALEHNEFSLVFQPVVNLADGSVGGAEALLRWQNRYIGAVNPDQFVPLAEEMGLILPIGEWLTLAACREAKAWQQAGLGDLRIAINVSPRQVQQTDIATTLRRALDESGLSPRLVTVEITESLILNSGTEIIRKLERVRDLGARIAVDDFGTGYASLSYLKHFPVDILKIDRSFVSEALNNADDARLIEAIIALGHSLGMKVVGEGVETRQQQAFLVERGCDLAQGYRFSPPLSAERFRDFVRNFEPQQP